MSLRYCSPQISLCVGLGLCFLLVGTPGWAHSFQRSHTLNKEPPSFAAPLPQRLAARKRAKRPRPAVGRPGTQPADPHRTFSWIFLAFGGAALLSGGGTWLASYFSWQQLRQDAQKAKSQQLPFSEYDPLYQRAQTLGSLAWTLGFVGIVATTTSIVLLLVPGKRPAAPPKKAQLLVASTPLGTIMYGPLE